VPLELGPKEGLALINGSPFATALGLEATRRLRTLVETATVAAALGVELTGGSARPFSSRVGALSRDPAQARVQQRLRALLGPERLRDDPAQPPVSFRVVPQVHGAVLDVVELAESHLAARIGAVTDSPLVLPADGDEPEGLYPSGGFHAAAPALWFDALGDAAAHLLNLVEKRLHRLLDARFSGLPDQLAVAPGRHAGVVSLHKAVVGLVAEARLLAAPASVHALDTSSGQEDVQAFTFLGFDRLERSLDVLETALGCELVALRQAAHLGGPVRSPLLATVVDLLADELEPVLDDRSLSLDVERARSLVRSGRLVAVG
jgi:histidine ammonia-lyase